MSSNASGEGDIHKAMVKDDIVDCMVALPGQLFYSTQIPACLWFLARNKNPGKGWRDRRGEMMAKHSRKKCRDWCCRGQRTLFGVGFARFLKKI